jgi:teichuronic acid exporter
VLLTRMLLPAEFGLMGMALVVINIAALFVDIGFSRALIQQKEVTQRQYSTIFFLNLLIALFLTISCYFAAEPLAVFFKQPLITPVFRVLSLTFLFNAINLVPSSILYRQMKFKVLTAISFTSAVISGFTGVLLAFNGYGVWSLVAQTLVNSFLVFVLSFIYVKWFPSLTFNLPSIKPLWNFGSRLFGASFLDMVFVRMDVFLIGKLFPPQMLGFYTRAQSMDTLVKNLSSQSIMSVLFPYIARNQDNRIMLAELFKKYLAYILLFSLALSGLLFVIAEPLFDLLFTSTWSFSAEIFQMLAVVGFAWPVSSLIVSIIEGVGNSKAFLKLEILKKLVFIPVYIFGFWFGIKGFLAFFIVGNLVAVCLNMFFVSKEINVKVAYQLKLTLLYLLNAILAVMLVVVITGYVNFNILVLQIVFNSSLFLGIFLLLCFVCKTEGLEIFNIGFKKVKLAISDKRN